MSCSWCIKCQQPVSMYEKYCDICIANYGVRQDETWHKYHHFADWEHDRKVEFEKDYQLALQSFRPTPLAPDVRQAGVIIGQLPVPAAGKASR